MPSEEPHHSALDEAFFGDATIGERGQIILPSASRKAAGIQPGDKLVLRRYKSYEVLLLIPEGEMASEKDKGQPQQCMNQTFP